MVGVEFMVGGWFASPIIKSVFEKAEKYLGGNYELQKDTQGMVKKLTDTLLLCQAAVKEVEKRAIINNPALADLLRKLKLGVYDAEDVLDNMEAKSIKEKVQGKNKVSKIVTSSLVGVKNLFLPDDNHKSLKKVVDELNQLSTDIPNILNLLNLNENYESHDHEVTNQRETISQPSEQVGLYGRQDELNLILDIILGSESESSKKAGHKYNNYQGLFVIPIVGMGGVGKTALAQAVYNNPEVQQTFAQQAWISVSKNLDDVKLVMRKIIQSLGGYLRLDVNTLQDISKNLSSTIGRVKFLIVLDDMFESEWDVIYTILSGGAPGSVVLITTQNQVFANRVGTFGPITLSALDSSTFWELFEHFAFRNKLMSDGKRRNLKSIGKIIANKLGGLPLAAKIIGNILRTKVDEETWEGISRSEWWDIPEVENQILPSIGLGYEQLKPNLRQCFAYCSIFPRNSLIEKDRLVHMWIAQNFIESDVSGVKKLEDIGRQWFDELVDKSFFQHAGDNNSYVIHELMHDLAVIVSSGDCFYLGEGVVKIPSGVRHLAVDTNNLEVIKGIRKHKILRSFLYFGSCQVEEVYSVINDTLSNLDRIRVLDLSYMRMEKELKPPTAIWNLKHLRFLDLCSTGIEVLTHSSFNVYHLQALYILKCQFGELPRDINKLINLRHLCANEETIAQISGIGQLTNLQELNVFVVDKKEGHKITELRNLREIRGSLNIQNFEKIKNKEEAKQANIVDKKYLDRILIYSSTSRRTSSIDMEVLEELQPHKDIKHLSISCYVGLDFPNWIFHIGDFLNLNTLFLSSCVNVEVLPPLGELPSLKFLQMEKMNSIKFINYRLYGKKQIVFPLLEVLCLFDLPNFEEWSRWTDAGTREYFPRLSKLLIIGSSKTLREVPLDLFSSSLKELTFHEHDSLIQLENSIVHLSSLTLLNLRNSSTIVNLNPLDMPLLEDLDLGNCPELKIKGELQSLTHLKRLRFVSCSKLLSSSFTTNQQKGKGLQVHRDEGLQSLTHIEADHSLWDHEYHLILGNLPSLRILNFNYSKFTRFTNHQNLWFQELTTLKEIHFSECEFEHLPTSLTLLSSLKKVGLTSCTKLESLSDSMPPYLWELSLMGCSQILVQRCQPNEGEDWQFISHIPVIQIDGITIRRPQISDVTD